MAGDSHEALRSHVAALSDADLDTPRKTNWGELRETRWLISVLLQHDTYHAGEINHVRSLLSGNDRWRWGYAHRGARSRSVPRDVVCHLNVELIKESSTGSATGCSTSRSSPTREVLRRASRSERDASISRRRAGIRSDDGRPTTAEPTRTANRTRLIHGRSLGEAEQEAHR